MFDVGDEILRAKARRTDEEGLRAKARRSEGGGEGANQARRTDGGGASSMRSASAVNNPIIISTFTSAQEREALRRALS